MTRKPILVPSRLRRPPATGWSWVDRRFFREHMAYLSREAVLLYYFLCDTADRHGLSFYSDGTLVIHNASFDIGFLNHELERIGKPSLRNEVIDTVMVARERHPGARSLCCDRRRYVFHRFSDRR